MSEIVTEALNVIRAVAAEVDTLKLRLSVALEEKASALARAEGAEAERDRYGEALEMLRRELPQYDCCRTGGPVSDSGGKHCPPESPCLTCRLERAERDRDFAMAVSERILRDLETTKAEVARLKWEASGSPMPGETPLSE